MFSKLKSFFDFTPNPDGDEDKETLHRELRRLKKENDELRLKHQMARKKSVERGEAKRYHLEFFLYDAKGDEEAQYTEADIHRYPMMGFTIHYLDDAGKAGRPEWMVHILNGLEETFAAMKVVHHTVDDSNLYSFFVDLKLYPHIEVKKCIYLIFQQLYQWQEHGRDQVSLRVHIGGEELYQELLNRHLEAV
ncbi:MAG: hypothetical protein M0Z65_03725 [Firmicutes bacterium]|uniref:Uncharacterized protein n=1 Tax=Melghirimyces thermohalophilus TaxID=1236220 RepID=A0A1G6NJT8_9BACL|nr:hypothetical protein [Melghirimyces thermohalophilus]MDA8352290.1 hypothetical protein [Bacillota bacterium]SDC68232.1 hypothetical protein SAMN04488112_11352 [Melghirimyces thermohalophilus]